jgi:hypothetical protein
MNSALVRSERTRFRGLICLVAILPAFIGGVGGLVLCFGADGHIAVELAHGEPCHSHEERDGGRPPTHASENAIDVRHSTCFDIPITMPGPLEYVYNQSLSGGDDDREYIPRPLYTLLQSRCAVPQQAAVRGIEFGTPPPIRHSLIEHRTTVLLI